MPGRVAPGVPIFKSLTSLDQGWGGGEEGGERWGGGGEPEESGVWSQARRFRGERLTTSPPKGSESEGTVCRSGMLAPMAGVSRHGLVCLDTRPVNGC